MRRSGRRLRPGKLVLLVNCNRHHGGEFGGDSLSLLLRRRSKGFAPPKGEIAINAPMPGLIVSIPVEEGQAVKSGQTVVVLESMKMENELKAPRDGTVSSLKVAPRQAVEQNQVLLILV